MKTKTLRELSRLCRELAKRMYTGRHGSQLKLLFEQTHNEILHATHRELTEEQIADTLAQTLLHARLAWFSADPRLHALSGRSELLPTPDSVLGQLLRLGLLSKDAVQPAEFAEVNSLLATAEVLSIAESRLLDLIDFDSFLNAHDPRGRSRHGVYFTPRTIASFIVRHVDQLLQDEFQLASGLADTLKWSQLPRREDAEQVLLPQHDRPFVNILDPAAGAGVFLVEVIECICTKLKSQWTGNDSDWNEAWNEYVVRHLLPRLHGIDLLLPACGVAWIRIAEKLVTTGYRFSFENPSPIDIKLGDAFSGPTDSMSHPEKVTVILGNPPFSALTTSGNDWIDGLLRSTTLGDRQVGGYYEVDGVSLGEKKLWLHDDYVKFLRYGQWQIERAGCGIVGFVTNHGYLDNLTFRGVRRSLLNTYPRISIVDLHGGRKNREQSPDGSQDQNVFGIDQGVAVGIFRKLPGGCQSHIARADLWGMRDQKSAALQDAPSLKWHSLFPIGPHYQFTNRRTPLVTQHEFDGGFPLDEIMPVHSTAAVTARDSFAIAFRPDELLTRMQELTDDSLSDHELRRRFFSRTRSRRYPSGDTRSWKLPEAREHARRAKDLRSLLRRCLYRPFDWRWVFWTDWMIDWPRNEVTRHMLAGDNLALVTRRQMIPNQPANYFYVADQIVIDGLIRSDNRGSESFFPLFLAESTSDVVSGTALAAGEAGTSAEKNRRLTPSRSRQMPLFEAKVEQTNTRDNCSTQDADNPRRSNFAEEFLAACANIVGQSIRNAPIDLFSMIYAQFHSGIYRQRFQHELCLGFPRVFLPANTCLFRQLIEFGKRLVEAHLLRGTWKAANDTNAPHYAETPITTIPHRGWPTHAESTVWLSQDCSLTDTPRDVWDFHIGGYQVCKKWLRDRAGQTFTGTDFGQYAAITRAVAETTQVMREIDAAIETAGGWQAAFMGRSL